MSFRRHAIPMLALALAAAAATPAVASAQFSKLKKAASDAAREAVGVKPEAPASSNSENFVITAERLDAVLAVLEPAMAEAERVVAFKAMKADYEKKRSTNVKCVESAAARVKAIPTAEGLQRASAVTVQVTALMQRMNDANMAKRYREAIALDDSMQVLSNYTTLAMFGLESACEKVPYKSAALIDFEAAHLQQKETNKSDGAVSLTPAQRAGMTHRQFGMVRERVALWALQQTGNAPAENNKYSIFTGSEQSALEARGDRLKKMAPFLKDQPARWTSWGDLQSW